MKSQRLHVGLIGLDLWLGGATYVHNLIRALKRLPDDERPRITLFCQNRTDMYEEVIPLVDNVVWYQTWPKVSRNRALTRVAQVTRSSFSPSALVTPCRNSPVRRGESAWTVSIRYANLPLPYRTKSPGFRMCSTASCPKISPGLHAGFATADSQRS